MFVLLWQIHFWYQGNHRDNNATYIVVFKTGWTGLQFKEWSTFFPFFPLNSVYSICFSHWNYRCALFSCAVKHYKISVRPKHVKSVSEAKIYALKKTKNISIIGMMIYAVQNIFSFSFLFFWLMLFSWSLLTCFCSTVRCVTFLRVLWFSGMSKIFTDKHQINLKDQVSSLLDKRSWNWVMCNHRKRQTRT